jgi:hypothetical protein
MTSQSRSPLGSAARSTQEQAETYYRRAWWSLVLFLPCFVGAFIVGEGLIDLLGYPSGDGDESPPFWAIVVAAVPALLLFAAPGLLSLFFSRRARRLGRPDSMVPAIVGLGVAGGFVALNVLSYVIGKLVA